MSPDDKKHETRFKCPNCQQPIVSRFTYCKQCETKFGRDTLFSCPRCGALVRQLERVCPGCEARLTDWGVGAEWLGTPLASASQKVEAPKEIEPGPIISKPLPELKKPEQVEQSPKPAPAPTPLPELKKPDQPDRSRKLTSAPTQKPTPSKITRAEALGRTNGLKNGRVNGTHMGRVNGTTKGLVNGTKRGLVNGTNRGHVNGTKQGRVNGFKTPVASERGEESSLMHRMIGGRVPAWQLVAVSFVVILLLSSVIILSLSPAAPNQSGIVIDGRFSDWASISSYRFFDLLPENIPQIIEAKINASDDHVNLYLRVQDNAFAGSDPSTFYVLVDADSNVDTGYFIAEHQLGADRLITLSGWDGRLMDSFDSNFSGIDPGNWTAWQISTFVSVIQSQSEIEMSIPDLSSNSLIQLETTVTGREYNSPIMSTHGTVVAKQESLLTGQLATTATQPIIRLSAIAMGVPSGNITVTATVTNDTNANLASQNLQISSTIWTTNDIAVNLSSLNGGDSFSFKTTLSASQFAGSIDVDGVPVRGYYLSIPSNIVVDGIFSDWIGKRISDSDLVQMENQNIDISEYGACTQSSSHFFYVSVVGEALGGADIPEERVKPSSNGGNGPPGVRLRKTGEDLLQVFIDKDPTNGTGLTIFGGNRTVQADYLIEVFGRKGIVTTSSVEQWSISSHKWILLGGIDDIGIGGKGIEFSVAKALLGNLTASEAIFYTTDWKARSDNCWFTGALKDPWVITSSGSSYQSVDGITWASAGSITLQGSGSNADTKIVDMISNVDRNFVWAVSDHGRIYTNVSGSNTWTSNLTVDLRSAADGKTGNQGYPISDVIAITTYKTGQNDYIYLLTKRGYLYYTKSAVSQGSSDVAWKNDTRRVASYTDFDDIWYANPNYYVMRSASGSSIYYAATSGTFNPTTTTGSSSTQTHMTIYPGASQATDFIYVLSQNGGIRRSINGGTSWAAFGNLPTPVGGNASTIYIGIALDPSNIIWATTDTGWVYKSTATLGGTFVKTGRPVTAGVVAIACPTPIPEFGDVLIPICLTMVIPAVIITRNRRNRRGRPDPD